MVHLNILEPVYPCRDYTRCFFIEVINPIYLLTLVFNL